MLPIPIIHECLRYIPSFKRRTASPRPHLCHRPHHHPPFYRGVVVGWRMLPTSPPFPTPPFQVGRSLGSTASPTTRNGISRPFPTSFRRSTRNRPAFVHA